MTNMTINDVKSLARDGVCMKELQPGAFCCRSEVGIYSFSSDLLGNP